jgi:hypothetical protein
MATSCTVTFISQNSPAAIIYRHHDGYPESAGKDILNFLDTCSKLPDSRLDDPSYLAAKYVVWLANQFNENPNNPLDFLGVGVCLKNPLYLDYTYEINCSSSPPSVTYFTAKTQSKSTLSNK